MRNEVQVRQVKRKSQLCTGIPRISLEFATFRDPKRQKLASRTMMNVVH